MNLAWEIRLRTEAGKTSDRVLAARDNMGYTELQMAENANQPKGSLMLSGFFSKASSFHPVITQVLAKAQSWEMGLFMSCPPGHRYFYRKVPSFLGKYFVVCFWVAKKAREGGDFVFKEDRDSKDGTGKSRWGAERLHCHSRSRDLLQQDIGSIKRLKGWAKFIDVHFLTSAKTVQYWGIFSLE